MGRRLGAAAFVTQSWMSDSSDLPISSSRADSSSVAGTLSSEPQPRLFRGQGPVPNDGINLRD
jgi:hypothetical protein